MSMITERHAAPATRPNFFGTMTSRVASYWKLTRAERQLAALDDRMLADIGLRRNDIQTMVWGR